MKCKHCGEADSTVAGLDSFQCLRCGGRTSHADAAAMPPQEEAKPKRAAKKAAASKKD